MMRLLPEQLRYCLISGLHSKSHSDQAQLLQSHMQCCSCRREACGMCQTCILCPVTLQETPQQPCVYCVH